MFNDCASFYSGKKIRLTVSDVCFLSHLCDTLREMSCFPWNFLLKYFCPLRSGRFPSLCNTQKVDLDPLEDHDYITLKNIIQDHFHYTQSTVAKTLLNDWSDAIQYFIKMS